MVDLAALVDLELPFAFLEFFVFLEAEPVLFLVFDEDLADFLPVELFEVFLVADWVVLAFDFFAAPA
ncbi:MAG: hypothetical protein K2N88_08260 [Muribaculaceae bacterium]|nr:hypothetical protein [Muribaculaceae bacterium]